MRTGVGILLGAVLLVGTPSNDLAGTSEDARGIVARAVQAAGGRDTLAHFGARIWKEKAVYHGASGDETYEASYRAAWPDKLRVEIGEFTLVVTGDQGWVKSAGEVREMTRAELEEHREGTYSAWVLTLVPLEDPEYGFELSALGESETGGRPVDGVQVRREGHFDINLYFDRATGLLALSKTRYREARSGSLIRQEMIFSDYREVSGVRSPTKISIQRDGKPAVEASIEPTYVERLDEQSFAKP